MADFLNKTPKIVYSRTMKKADWANTQVVHEFNPKDVKEMKQKAGKDMIIFGSSSIVSRLTENRLIDEYQIIVNPVMVGGGIPLITGLPAKVGLTLKEAKQFSAGNVLLRHALSRPAC